MGSTIQFLLAATVIACFSAAHCAAAREPNFSEMNHTSWTARDGAPQGINALAQGTDGLLWIGSEGGLFSFDGQTFSAFQARPGDRDLTPGPVDSLFVARDGAIWVGFRNDGIARIAGGRTTIFDKAGSMPLANVEHIQQAADGAMWATTYEQDLVRFGVDGLWRVEPLPLGDPGGHIFDIFIDSSNTLWVPQGGRLYRRPLNQTQYFATETAADLLFGFAETPDHSLWISDTITNDPQGPSGRTQHIDPSGKLLARLPEIDITSDLLLTPGGSLILTSWGAGVLRVPPEALTGSGPEALRVPRDRYAQKDGLSSDVPKPLLWDSDRNLWVGGQRGLDRFREARLVAFVPKTGIAKPAICAGADGVMWIATGNDANDLYRFSGGIDQLVAHDAGQIITMTCGPDGDVWLAGTNGIWQVHAGRATPLPQIGALGPLGLAEVVAAPDHVVFATVVDTPKLSGTWQYARGSWSKLPGIPSTSLHVDSTGRLWAGFREDLIELPLEGDRNIPVTGAGGLGYVYVFLDTSQGLVAGGMNGIAILKNNRFEMLSFADRSLGRGVAGLVQSRDGDLWLNTLRGAVQVRSEELKSAVRDPRLLMKAELVTEGNFVGPPSLGAPTPTTARDGEGNLWFATLSDVFRLDPAHLNLRSRPPKLSIRSISADGRPVSDGGRIGPGPETLDIRYLGVNLTTPEGVAYRYRLDGLDDDWQDASHRSEAIYPHLRPGSYRFHVIASNGDGVWTPESSASFTVLPFFYQTIWFLLLCVLAGALLLWSAIAVRLGVISHEIRARAEERADERIRISRDLHDTLLQGVQGLMLTVHVAAQRASPDGESRKMLERALSTADRVVVQGRNRVNDLRSDRMTDAEIVGALENVGRDLASEEPIEFQVVRAGLGVVLRSDIADEVFYIAREALTNSFRHSGASQISVELTYGPREFALLCRDTGRGFSTNEQDKPGHWGLKGMHERARKLGGQLRCQSEPARGTRILLTIPAARAYESSPLFGFLRYLRLRS